MLFDQASAGDYAAVDLGYNGCQPWPKQMHIAALTQRIGLPTSFTADASGAALQPSPDAADWENLIIVQNFKPATPQDCYHAEDSFVCGVLNVSFPILPHDSPGLGRAPVLADPATTAFSVLQSDLQSDTILPLDTGVWFQQNSRACCLNITAQLVSAGGVLQQLPSWASIGFELVHNAPRQLNASHVLHLQAQPGAAAVGTYIIRISATDASLPGYPSASKDISLQVSGELHARLQGCRMSVLIL